MVPKITAKRSKPLWRHLPISGSGTPWARAAGGQDDEVRYEARKTGRTKGTGTSLTTKPCPMPPLSDRGLRAEFLLAAKFLVPKDATSFPPQPSRGPGLLAHALRVVCITQ